MLLGRVLFPSVYNLQGDPVCGCMLDPHAKLIRVPLSPASLRALLLLLVLSAASRLPQPCSIHTGIHVPLTKLLK